MFAVAGALLTALGFGIGAGVWGWVVLAAFVATLLGGLAVKYGAHRFVAAYLLNVWLIIALGLPTLISFDLPGLYRSGLIHAEPWKQALAWLVGSRLWIAYASIMWLAHGRDSGAPACRRDPRGHCAQAADPANYPFAVIRAVGVSIAVAIAFGLHVAQRLPDARRRHHCHEAEPQQSTFVAVQRVAGTILGAAVALLVLLAVDNRTALEVIIVVLLALAASIRTVQLHLVHRSRGRGRPDRHGRAPPDQPHRRGTADPVHLRRRSAIAVIVMFLAGLLQRDAAESATTRTC